MVPARSATPEGRVYLRELGPFLGEPITRLVKWARRRNFLYSTGALPQFGKQYYVTDYGAMRLIAHFRMKQGEKYAEGHDYFKWKTYKRDEKRRLYAKQRAEREALNARQLLALANPVAGTEDEGGQDRTVSSEVKPEAVVGNPGGVRPTR